MNKNALEPGIPIANHHFLTSIRLIIYRRASKIWILDLNLSCVPRTASVGATAGYGRRSIGGPPSTLCQADSELTGSDA